jgi:hypothetical protein
MDNYCPRAEKSPRHHQLAHNVRMPDRHLQRDRATVAEAEEVRLGDVQMLKQRRSIFRGLHKAERSVGDIRRVPETLLLKRDELAVARQTFEYVPKGCPDGVAAAMQQHQRRACGARRTVDLVEHLEAIHRSVAGLCLHLHSPFALTHPCSIRPTPDARRRSPPERMWTLFDV